MLPEERPPSWQHQKNAFKFMRRRAEEGAGLGIPPGGGKTRPTIREIQKLHLAGEVNLVLICNILSGMYVWVENWGDWADVPATFIDLRETGSEGLRKAEKLAAAGNLVICLVSYGASWQIGYTRVKKAKKVKGQDVTQYRTVMEPTDTTLADVEWDYCVLDEIHKIKSPQSKVSLFFRTHVAPRCKHRRGLTGSLIKKRPGDCWAPIKFLTGNEIFDGPYSIFAAQYGIPHPHIRGAIVAWTNLETLARKIAKCFFIVDIEECMDLPPAIHSYKKVKLGPKARKAYDEITRDAFTELEEWEAEGRKEYRRLVEWLRTAWPEKMYKSPSWPQDDDGLFRQDIERDAKRWLKEHGVFEEMGMTARYARHINMGDFGTERFREGGEKMHMLREDILSDLLEHALTVNTVTISHVLTIMQKQKQIASGYVVPDPPETDPGRKMEPIDLGNEKITEALEELEKLWMPKGEAVNPVVLIVTSNPEEQKLADAIAKDPRFKFRPKILNGSVDGAAKRHALVASGKSDPCFILKAQVGAESIDLRWAKTFIFLSKNADTVQYDQLLARNRRGGQTETCTYIHIHAEGTVDERIEQIVQGDLDLARKVEKDWRAVITAK